MTLNNVTISSNFASSSGGGIASFGGSASLMNSILAGNTTGHWGPDCYATIVSSGYNLIGNNMDCAFTSIIGDFVGTNPNPIDPLLAPLQGNGGTTFTQALMVGSPAINAGNPATCLSTDQRGTARVGTCDIGAYEYNTPGVSIVGGIHQSTLLNSAFSSPLKVLVIDNSKNAVSNALVTFAAPSSGPSGTFANTGTFVTTATTNVNGVVVAPTFTSNNLAGTYSVIPSVSGLSTLANFDLTNMKTVIKTYTANNTTTLPGTFLCDQTTFNCTNGSNPHADAAQQYAIGTYDFYATKHNRDSINNAGMTIISTVHYDSGYSNAFWDGSQAVYGDSGGWPLADDVVAHELTHGVTEHESNLYYFYQSGAINEFVLGSVGRILRSNQWSGERCSEFQMVDRRRRLRLGCVPQYE